MKLVVTLGGNALLRRGDAMTEANQRAQVQVAAKALATVAKKHELILSHGNGPQVGLIALQNDAFNHKVPAYPLDNLGAQSQAMIGYLFAQAMKAELPEKTVISVLTQTEVNPADPAFSNPTKFIGPVYSEAEANALKESKGWVVKPDGKYWRRVVPSPKPQHIVEMPAIEALVNAGMLVIAAGGGGVPVIQTPQGPQGLEAVIDKDYAGALMATELKADKLIIATDVDGVYVSWGTPEQKRIARANPQALLAMGFAAGSMGPKIEAAANFATAGLGDAVIGALENITDMVENQAGTVVSASVEGIEFA